MAASAIDIIEQMAECGIAGIDAADLVVDGRYHRFRPEGGKTGKKSCWYRLFDYVSRSGKPVIVGAFGRGPDTYKVQATLREWSTEERAAFQADVDRKRRDSAKARREEALSSAQRAQRIWSRLPITGSSPYLDRKGVQAYGLRFNRTTAVVPLRDAAGAIVGLQFISDDGTKLFNTGIEKVGKFHMIGEATPERPLCFAEGYATGASIFAATGWPVVVCFDAGNMEPVSAELRKLFPDTRFVFCGDDDRHLLRRLRERLIKLGAPHINVDGIVHVFQSGEVEARVSAMWLVEKSLRSIKLVIERGGDRREYLLENAGRKAALLCAKKFRGDAVFPAFAAADTDGTDFNDLHLAEGSGIVRSQIVNALASAEAPQAAPGKKKYIGDLLVSMVQNFVLIYDAKVTIWDGLRRRVVTKEALQMAYGAVADDWFLHPDRLMIDAEDLVFDPTGAPSPKHRVNMFNGLPLEPDLRKPHRLIIEHLHNLCGNDDDLFNWVTRWLAVPLRKPGAKMQTSLILHGRIEGTGKTTFFKVMREIYGRYSTTVTQHQLNDSYTDWLSQKMFCVAEEVLTQQEKKLQKGFLKNLVTNDTIQISAKFLPTRAERNHVNFVFLSNEIQPLALDEFDRRYTVAWCDRTFQKEYFEALGREIDAGGAAGFYAWLLDVDLDGFDEFTKPHNNAARTRLITLGLSPERRFYELWKAGELAIPWSACRADDLYQAFRAYCRICGERFIPSQTVFGGLLGTERIRRERLRITAYASPEESIPTAQRATVYQVPDTSMPDDGWEISSQIQAFQKALWPFLSQSKGVVT